MGAGTQKKVQRKFKLRGLTLRKDALDEVLSFLSQFEDAEEEAIDLLLDEIDKESLKSPILDKEAVHGIVNLLLEADAAIETSSCSSNSAALRIVDAFLIPKICYDQIKKVFYECTGKLPIHGEASAKAALYRDRFQLLHQRLSRDRHFSKPAFDAELTHSGSCEITPIQSLIGCSGRRWIMGVISQLEDGRFFLEDLTEAVPVDLSNAISLTQFMLISFVFLLERILLWDVEYQDLEYSFGKAVPSCNFGL